MVKTASEMAPRSPAGSVLALRHSKQWTNVRPSWEGGGVRTDTLGSMISRGGSYYPPSRTQAFHPSVRATTLSPGLNCINASQLRHPADVHLTELLQHGDASGVKEDSTQQGTDSSSKAAESCWATHVSQIWCNLRSCW